MRHLAILSLVSFLAACGTDLPARCGDGVRDVGEGCDDGITDAGEQCDDGLLHSDLQGDACRTDCTLPFCGDGVVHEGSEVCDDGNLDPGDFCTTAGRPATCGDGILWPGVEACDDGNRNDADSCRNDCALP